ncbi:MAG TPA: DNA-directed RNA polymerase subunit beta [Dehalococcoidia bacterium]|nr:DNA-directed RNA polymerase subunit beta [Dehalococcoidia bacterium]
MVLSSEQINNGKYNYKGFNRLNDNIKTPELIHVQTNSFNWLLNQGLKELFEEISPIDDLSGGRFEVRFISHEVRDSKFSEEECREKEITYSAPLYATVQLKIISTGMIKEQILFMGELPKMTKYGTFIINGAERVVVSQLVRSPGAYFTTELDPTSGKTLCLAKLIPYRGAWVELETSNKNIISVKIDRKRKLFITTLLRAIGYETDNEIRELFSDIENKDDSYIEQSLEKDSNVKTREDALIEFYKRIRPGEPPNVENAISLIENMFFNPRKYDLGRVGRYQLNRKLQGNIPLEQRTLTKEDIVSLARTMININNNLIVPDDIDHLGNRRVRAVGELIQNQIRVGLLRMERVIKERMTTQMDPEETTPAALINIRPIVASLREFFGGSQLSQFMDQTNPLSELTHKRRLSATGPGGLSRERAGFDVRDVHHSHYGRICPIETPEGPNIGLLGSLATYAKTNDYGFIETPYKRVMTEISINDHDIIGRTILQDIKDDKKIILKSQKIVTKDIFEEIQKLKKSTLTSIGNVKVQPFVTHDQDNIVYLSADQEDELTIGQAMTPLDSKGQIIGDQVEVRMGDKVAKETPDKIALMDVSPMQIVSVSTSLIPFLEHDDANRALMGSNMQRQAVPLLRPEAPLVGTGMEKAVALDSGQVIVSKTSGVVSKADNSKIEIIDKNGDKEPYVLNKFVRSNQGTCINQKPIVKKGEKVTKDQAIVDSSSTDNGELALGQNLLVGFMSFEGYNYEDAIVLSEKLVRDDKFTSLHIEKFETEARETKLGDEEITRDIPNVGDENLRDLDEFGIIRIGASVSPGDILVGKITPKGETELTAEEKLLRAIFGEKARDVKDTSLRVPHGQYGKVIKVRILEKEKGDNVSAGVLKIVRVWIADKRKIKEGDKIAGRHGNKGVISKILPIEDMPYLPDGTPLDIILNPIGVPSRMNLGQLLETHLGSAANTLGFKARTPVFAGADTALVEDNLARAWFVQESNSIDKSLNNENQTINWDKVTQWLKEHGYKKDKLWNESPTNKGEASKACLSIWLSEYAKIDTSKIKPSDLLQKALKIQRDKNLSAPIFGKTTLYNGRTGEKFDQPVTVGNVYMLKLIHLVEDKMHARSTGPYSLITQQPLGGKAQFGGQRFGEMEVWALEAYSAAYSLQEILTIKSDDIIGRVKTYEALIKGDNVTQPGMPESFQVLLKELQGLGLSIELTNKESSIGNLGESSFESSLSKDNDSEDLFEELQSIEMENEKAIETILGSIDENNQKVEPKSQKNNEENPVNESTDSIDEKTLEDTNKQD